MKRRLWLLIIFVVVVIGGMLARSLYRPQDHLPDAFQKYKRKTAVTCELKFDRFLDIGEVHAKQFTHASVTIHNTSDDTIAMRYVKGAPHEFLRVHIYRDGEFEEPAYVYWCGTLGSITYATPQLWNLRPGAVELIGIRPFERILEPSPADRNGRPYPPPGRYVLFCTFGEVDYMGRDAAEVLCQSNPLFFVVN